MAKANVSSTVLKAKFRGCMIGALLGDCLGKPFEFKRPELFTEINKLFVDQMTRESARMLYFSDDTSMTLSIASSLVEKKKIDTKDMAKKFVHAYKHEPVPRDYGFHVRFVFEELEESKFKDVYLPAKLQFDGLGSYGNGAAMRISPVALFASNRGEEFIVNAVKESSLITHAHRHGYNGAILQSFAIIAALKLDPSDEFNPLHFIDNLLQKMENIETKDMDQPYCESLKTIQDLCLKNMEDISPGEIAEYLGNKVLATKSVPTAIYSFLRGMKPIKEFENSNPFLRTLFFAISVGGDTDTIATMAGSIAGAYYGEEIIPDVLQNQCESIETVVKMANKLYDLAQKK